MNNKLKKERIKEKRYQGKKISRKKDIKEKDNQGKKISRNQGKKSREERTQALTIFSLY